jgi:hypothetical protein
MGLDQKAGFYKAGLSLQERDFKNLISKMVPNNQSKKYLSFKNFMSSYTTKPLLVSICFQNEILANSLTYLFSRSFIFSVSNYETL